MRKGLALTLGAAALSVGTFSLFDTGYSVEVSSGEEVSSYVEESAFSDSGEQFSNETISSYEEVGGEDSKGEIDYLEEINKLQDNLAEKFKEFQATKIYTIIVDAVVVVYALWGVLDKLLDKKTRANFSATAQGIYENIQNSNVIAESIKENAKVLKEDYEATEKKLLEAKQALDVTTEKLKEVIAENAELTGAIESIKKAILALAASDEALVRSGGYAKVLAALKGVEDDGKQD